MIHVEKNQEQGRFKSKYINNSIKCKCQPSDIKKIKEKYVFILIYAENTFNKLEHLFMIIKQNSAN